MENPMRKDIEPVLIILCWLVALGTINIYPFSSLLPKSGELPGWRSSGSPQHVEGDDLFLLINGGAEIYHEYGFKQVITGEYKNTSGKAVNLEIFEMQSPAAAYGMYTFKTGEDVGEVPIGQGAKIEDYYLNFWKSTFLVTLTGFDAEEETRQGLIAIARVIDRKIESMGEKPALLKLLPEENLKESSIKYLKGNLALFNHYEFAPENIFGLKEGVIAGYEGYKLFIFKYESSQEAKKWYKHGTNQLKISPRFKDFTSRKDACCVTDPKGQHLYLQPHQHYILITLGKTPGQARDILQKMTASHAFLE